MSFFAPTKFIWRLGGNQVHLCGSFTRWVETVPMVPEEGQPGVFSVVVHLPPGYHQYKFIVDGEWRHDEGQPFMPDPLGNVNNWLYVRKPESQSVGQLQGQHHSPVPSTAQLPSLEGQDGIHGSAMEMIESEFDGEKPENDHAEGVMASLASQQDEEPLYTRNKIKEFLSHHTAFELIPESGKVVLLDVDLPLRQAFHALHEQGIASAPLFDSETGSICGVISASDFITTLQRLRNMVSTSSNPMSEAEMDQHTIRGLREELTKEGAKPKDIITVSCTDSLQMVVDTLFNNRCNMAPIVTGTKDAKCDPIQDVLHSATLSGVLACLIRHFRASLASLPLLAQPLYTLPLGTWCPNSQVVLKEKADDHIHLHGTEERRDRRKVIDIVTVNPSTLLSEALGMLLNGGFSCLPVVDDNGTLVDVYARADITTLAKSNAYSRMQFEDVTVGQALALIVQPSPSSMSSGGSHTWVGGSASPSASHGSIQDLTSPPVRQRVHACTIGDPLRSIVERLSVPGVRRLLVVNPETKRLEGIVSLSDVAAFMLT